MQPENDWTREELEKDYIGKMSAITVSTEIVIKGKQRILDQSEMEKLLRNARRISVKECGCRNKLGNCDNPKSGCLNLDDEADSAIEKGAREISVEEALQVLEETYNAGLVHMAYVFTGKDKPTYICSCCSCCCHSLGAAMRYGYSDHVFYSDKISVHDFELCENCGECVDRCHFGARSLEDDKLIFKSEKCGGCGLCLRECNYDAISMKERL
ncbi:MAG: hypothetical protein JSV49_07370 [Thermoplasmata archaeon]|nr:MAG: hypothetical protein JSV49_07370 [Thermoplasmata archaeon]